jgi:hypothetical protein
MYSFPNSHSHLNALSRWGDINHFAPGASFLRRIESLTMLQRHRHFRSEIFEVVTLGGSTHENRERAFALFSDMDTDSGEDEMQTVLSEWSTGCITEGTMYFKKVFPAQDDDLAYYAVIRLVRSHLVSLRTLCWFVASSWKRTYSLLVFCLPFNHRIGLEVVYHYN